MDEKRELLTQMGWSDELIEKCLSDKTFAATIVSKAANTVRNFVEHDCSELNVNMPRPITSDGTHLH